MCRARALLRRSVYEQEGEEIVEIKVFKMVFNFVSVKTNRATKFRNVFDFDCGICVCR